MKILKCHIENFGKLQNFDFDFNSSFNEIIEDNGWGKTTFSVFIKAMFYGLADTKRSVKENERTKYSPWQGGNFGGYIVFEVNGEKYKLERFFGKKESEDTFSLIDLKTGKLSNKYSSNIGIELFDLDADAYERSTYIPQKEIANGINDKISSKLINMIQGTSNLDSFENAQNSIKKRMTALKKRGNSGLIADCEADISNVSEQIDSLKISANHIEEFQDKINIENESIEKLEQQKNVISKKIKQYSDVQKIVANKKYVEDLENKINDLTKKVKSNENVLNGNEVNYDELKHNQSRDNSKNLNIEQLESLKAEVVEIPENLNAKFKNNTTTKNEIDKFLIKSKTCDELTNEIKLLNQPKEIYSHVEQKTNKKPIYIALTLALVMIVFGAILISSNISIAIVLFILGVICGCVGGFIYIKNYIEIKTSSQVIIKQDNSNSDELKEKTSKLENLVNEINEFISKFSQEEIVNKTDFLYELKSDLDKYNNLISIKENNNEKIKTLKSAIKTAEIAINEYLNKFNIDSTLSNQDKFDIINKVFIQFENDSKELSSTIEKLDNFKKENDFDKITNVNVENVDIDELQKQEKHLQEEIDNHRETKAQFTKNIDNIRQELSKLDELEENCENLKSQKEELLSEYKVLDLATKFLNTANDNLSSKYLKPMKTSLDKYMKLLLKDNFQELNLDTNLNVSFETYGKLRELDYLSKGLQEVVDVCIRFSLIDVLFAKEKPFLILDDPFVNMDKSKIENAVKLIKDVSDTYQIIYLICHESRK